MATGGATGDAILRGHVARLARAAPVAPPPVAHPPTPTRIAATAAAQSARRVAGLTVICEQATAATCSLAELREHLPDHALLAIIEGGIDRLGVIALSPGTVSALIEMQTLGRLTAAAPEARKPTRADAALAAEFIDGLLAGFEGVAQTPDIAVLAGFRYASHLADPRPLDLMLEDRGFQTLRLDLRLGPAGEREGVIFLAVPLLPGAPRLAPPPAASEDGTGKAPQTPPAAPRKTLAAAMREAPVALSAVLCRRRITLAELRALVPGAMLSLPRQSLSEARLEAAGGHVLAMGRLGEADGFHALRLLATQSGRPAPPRPRAEEPPIGDLAQPDAFRAPSEAEEGLRNWQEALTTGQQAG